MIQSIIDQDEIKFLQKTTKTTCVSKSVSLFTCLKYFSLKQWFKLKYGNVWAHQIRPRNSLSYEVF